MILIFLITVCVIMKAVAEMSSARKYAIYLCNVEILAGFQRVIV